MDREFPENHDFPPPEEAGINLLQENGEVLLGDFPVSQKPEFDEEEIDDQKKDLLARYIQEVNRYRLLEPEEERELARIARNGDEKASLVARKKMATRNLRLVIKIARDFDGYWTRDLMDLIQEGNAGLMHAIRKFDPDLGVKFSYYASFWIKAYILKYTMDNWRLVKLGTTQAQRKLFYNLNREKEKLARDGFEVTPELLAEAIGVTEAEVLEMEQRLSGWDLSLEAPLKSGSDETHKDYLTDDESQSPEEQVARKDLLEWLDENIQEFRKTIGKRENFILDKRILSDSPATLEEIGINFNVSRERVRQNEKSLLEKLRVFADKIRFQTSQQKISGSFLSKKEFEIMAKRGGLTGVFSQTTAVRLRAVGIPDIVFLKSLTADQFVSRTKSKLQKHQLTVRSVAERMVEKGLFFSDGEEATRGLIEYDPKYYEPSPKLAPSPAPRVEIHPPVALAESAPSEAAVSLKGSKAIVEAVPGPEKPASDDSSFESILGKIGRGMDELTKGRLLERISMNGAFQGPDGKRYRISICEESSSAE